MAGQFAYLRVAILQEQRKRGDRFVPAKVPDLLEQPDAGGMWCFRPQPHDDCQAQALAFLLGSGTTGVETDAFQCAARRGPVREIIGTQSRRQPIQQASVGQLQLSGAAVAGFGLCGELRNEFVHILAGR